MSTEFWFPTPIYYHIISGAEFDQCQQEIKLGLQNYNLNELNSPWGDSIGTTFQYEENHNFIEEMNALQNQIKLQCLNFLQEINVTADIKIKESWLNVSKKNNFQHFHVHHGYDLSGVYYYQTTGNDGDIQFKHPSLTNRIHSVTAHLNTTVKFTPEVGKLIIFPSFLEHAVFHNQSEDTRISISFNAELVKS